MQWRRGLGTLCVLCLCVGGVPRGSKKGSILTCTHSLFPHTFVAEAGDQGSRDSKTLAVMRYEDSGQLPQGDTARGEYPRWLQTPRLHWTGGPAPEGGERAGEGPLGRMLRMVALCILSKVFSMLPTPTTSPSQVSQVGAPSF